MGMLDKVTGGTVGKLKGAKDGVKGFVGSLKTVKGAIIATGIGALVVGLTAVVTFFTKTKRGAELLERATAGLGAAISVITDKFSGFGETIVSAFEDPQQAIKDLWTALKENIVNRFEGLINQFMALQKVIQGVFSLDWDMA